VLTLNENHSHLEFEQKNMPTSNSLILELDVGIFGDNLSD